MTSFILVEYMHRTLRVIILQLFNQSDLHLLILPFKIAVKVHAMHNFRNHEKYYDFRIQRFKKPKKMI